MGFLGTKDFPVSVVDAKAYSGNNVHARVTGNNANPTLLLSASDGRTHASIFNHVNASLHIGFGMVPTLTLFDVKMTSGSYFELQRPIWCGEVWGIWDANGGVAMIHDVSGTIG